ncbi:MAG: FeoB-associated Cys-rich membrane protein [Clostridium sp.]
MELIITLCIVGFAGFIIYKNVKKSSSGECNCSSCHAKCPSRKE